MTIITQAGLSFLLLSRELASHGNWVRLHILGTVLFSICELSPGSQASQKTNHQLPRNVGDAEG